jgi:uncharacterized protein
MNMAADRPVSLPQDAGRVLLPLARASIAAELGRQLPAPQDVAWLGETGACFITLMQEARLRGCIGTLRAHRALAADVHHNAIAAAFRDPRFSPLSIAELDTVSVEISVLSPLEPLVFVDERDALDQFRPGVDGLVFEYGRHSSTFLPQVWEEFPEPGDFMGHLKYKAGLPPDFWDGEIRLSRYTVVKWREADNGS